MAENKKIVEVIVPLLPNDCHLTWNLLISKKRVDWDFLEWLVVGLMENTQNNEVMGLVYVFKLAHFARILLRLLVLVDNITRTQMGRQPAVDLREKWWHSYTKLVRESTSVSLISLSLRRIASVPGMSGSASVVRLESAIRTLSFPNSLYAGRSIMGPLLRTCPMGTDSCVQISKSMWHLFRCVWGLNVSEVFNHILNGNRKNGNLIRVITWARDFLCICVAKSFQDSLYSQNTMQYEPLLLSH